MGPVVGLLGSGLEIVDLVQQEKEAKQVRETQGKIDREFAGIANQVEQQLKDQLQSFERQTFDYIEMQLRTEKNKYRDQQIGNSKQAEKLMNVQKSLDDLIIQISMYRS